MAWRYPEDRFADGDVVTSTELMNDIDAVAAEMNGFLDRDNLGVGIVGIDDLANKSCSSAKFVELTAGVGLEYLRGGDGGNWKDITGLSTDILCQSGMLQVSASVAFGAFAGLAFEKMMVAILVDGSYVAVQESANQDQIVYIFADVPVASSSVNVRVMIKLLPPSNPTLGVSIEVDYGCLEARNVVR